MTNGYRLYDHNFLNKLEDKIDKKLGYISISIKGADEEQYYKISGTKDGYDKVCQGIKNISYSQIPFGCSVVLSKNIAGRLLDIAKIANLAKERSFLKITFCRPSLDDKTINDSDILSTKESINEIRSSIDDVRKILKNKVSIEQSLPICAWPEDVLQKLLKLKIIGFGCAVRDCSGIVLAPDGKIYLCNSLYGLPVGKIGDDFSDIKTFEQFWFNDKLFDIRNEIMAYPSKRCISCDKKEICGGGCPLQWFSKDGSEIDTYK